MTHSTKRFTANPTATNSFSTSGSVQASAYQQGTSQNKSAATSGNTTGAHHTATGVTGHHATTGETGHTTHATTGTTGSGHTTTGTRGITGRHTYTAHHATTGATITSPTSTFAGVASAALNSSLAKSSVSCSTSITNLTVSSLEETVTFYTNVFGWEVEQMTESYAVLTNGTSSICAITEAYAAEVYGFATSSPFSTGDFPTVTTTLVCKDVPAVWDAAIVSGATPVQSPTTNVNNITSATLIGPDNYVWVITNNSNMLI